MSVIDTSYQKSAMRVILDLESQFTSYMMIFIRLFLDKTRN